VPTTSTLTLARTSRQFLHLTLANPSQT